MNESDIQSIKRKWRIRAALATMATIATVFIGYFFPKFFFAGLTILSIGGIIYLFFDSFNKFAEEEIRKKK